MGSRKDLELRIQSNGEQEGFRNSAPISSSLLWDIETQRFFAVGQNPHPLYPHTFPDLPPLTTATLC
jgi:hypothetical protein